MSQPYDLEAAARNGDCELWRGGAGDYYADSLFVTEDGTGIGMNCGGHVIVKPIREWHALALSASPPRSPEGPTREQLARRIDPIAWEEHNEGMTPTEREIWHRACERARLTSLETADTILPWLCPAAPLVAEEQTRKP